MRRVGLWLLTLGCRVSAAPVPDLDGDGWCAAPATAWDVRAFACEGGAGFGDCDDADPAVHPDAEEACNARDDDCDLEIDEGLVVDADLDGFHDAARCPALGTDCDDGDPDVNPDAVERCDDVDWDCTGTPDDAPDAPPWTPDVDRDGHGAAGAAPTHACTSPGPGWSDRADDCDDADPDVHPGAPERCNVRDDDCDEAIDEGLDLADLWPDADGDEHGDRDAVPARGCRSADGWAPTADDCDDADALRHPDADELCDGADQDCDEEADEGLPTTRWWPDADGDGHGDQDAPPAETCADLSATHAEDARDCDDTTALVKPGAPERCNGADDDCDGLDDEGLPAASWWPDVDGDRYGDEDAQPTVTCLDLSATHVQDGRDCDDGDGDVHPGAPEVCNLADDDCDDGVDEGLPTTTWYLDGDRDRHGSARDPGQTTCADLSATRSTTNDDCDDANGAVHPGAVEVCNGADEDCDEAVDDGCPVVRRFHASAWRGPSLLDLDRAPASQTGCAADADADVWMSPRYGTPASAPEIAGPGPLDFVPGTKVLFTWQVEGAASVALPELGLTQAPPSGSRAVNLWTPGLIRLIATPSAPVTGDVVVGVALRELDYPHDGPGTAARCVPIPSPEGLFVDSPQILGAPPPTPAQGITCAVDPFGDNPICSTCASGSRVTTADGWWSNGASLVFDAAEAPPLAATGVFTVQGWPVPVPPDAELWMTWDADVEEGVDLRARLAFTSDPRDVCAVDPLAPPSSFVYGTATAGFQSHAWSWGRPNEARAAFTGGSSTGSFTRPWAIPSLQVHTDGSGVGVAYVDDVQLWCCGASCGACIDRDGDGFGPWCGTVAAPEYDWDCDDTNPLRFPGNPLAGCGPLWSTDLCLLP